MIPSAKFSKGPGLYVTLHLICKELERKRSVTAHTNTDIPYLDLKYRWGYCIRLLGAAYIAKETQ